MWLKRDDNFTLTNALFRAVEVTKNIKKCKCKYSGYRIRFDRFGTFSLSISSEFGRNVIKFDVYASSSVYIDNKGKDILILGKGRTSSAQKKYSINFIEHDKYFCLSLHYNYLLIV